jgi:hypothetical protein
MKEASPEAENGEKNGLGEEHFESASLRVLLNDCGVVKE